ncbi:O-antigen ligase domain-containing protein [Pantoea ananatis]|uniref:O-antigen ligase family protein n=1 Tax=Pantoea ananas TaxID=553 RepID=UPI000D73B80E|nr:O-antigen ligase family protein [Pantoea ananatis]AWQ20723.1 O-antigen ligase domain-containing protein [Pantoea ananatis]MBN6032669.1 O-antigen ligase family protein [Pantoea ananatis]
MMIKFRIPAIVLVLSCISFSTALNASTICRNALFLAFLFSLIDFVRVRPVIRKDSLLFFFVTTILFAGGFILHGKLFKSVENFAVDENYYYAALRILMGVVVFYYLSQRKENFSEKDLFFFKFLILFGFSYLSVQAIYIHSLQPHLRLEIKTVSTTVAYIFAIQAFAAMYIVSTWRNQFSFLCNSLIFLLSFYIIILTETRSVIATFPFIVLVFFIQSKIINLKTILCIAVVVASVVILNRAPLQSALSRLTLTVNEVKDFQNNNGNTSLGVRFSLWEAGAHAFIVHPFGQSADQRYDEVKHYITSQKYQNTDALRSIDFHMHNDLIDTLSLRGIWGGLLFILFFSSMAYVLIKNSENLAGLMLLLLPNLVYGLTDTLLIDLRCATVLILGLPVYLLIKRKV